MLIASIFGVAVWLWWSNRPLSENEAKLSTMINKMKITKTKKE